MKKILAALLTISLILTSLTSFADSLVITENDYVPELAWSRGTESKNPLKIGVNQYFGNGLSWANANAIDLLEKTNVWDGKSDSTKNYNKYALNGDNGNFATWKLKSNTFSEKDVRRFQSTFTLPSADYKYKYFVAKDYEKYANGAMYPINDDFFMFIYPKNLTLNDDPTSPNYFGNFLVSWASTAGTGDAYGKVLPKPVTQKDGTVATTLLGQEANIAIQNRELSPHTDGWFINGTKNTIAEVFQKFPSETQYVFDIFTTEFYEGGGIDEPLLVFSNNKPFAPQEDPDDAVAEKATPTPTVEPEPTLIPGNEIDLSDVSYAYIFGYEPTIDEATDTVIINMAMEDNVTREQVCAMIMRMIDQKYNHFDVAYPVTANISAHKGTWYERGLAYISSQGGFSDVDKVKTGAVTRGEIAKLITFGLNLSKTAETAFNDISDNKYKSYIETVCAYGYMKGISATTFAPDKVMTRAEFCSLFNNIISRNEMGLIAQDGSKVNHKTYRFSDMNENHWAYEICLKATSAYDENGLIDVQTRLSNIRNVLDKFKAQTKY